MKARHKAYLRVNLISLIFVIVSFISVTLAWFAFSGLANVSTEIGVKAWYIELEKDGVAVSNDIVISLSAIYPGMDTVSEIVSIRNLGDSDAQVNYSITSARILGKEEDDYVVDGETVTSEYVEEILAHEYPFRINMNLTKNYVLSKGEESFFEVSVSWPLDSDRDALDSLWGTEAYKFYLDEEEKKAADPNYKIRAPIHIVISVAAEQFVESDSASDIRYNLGDTILFDVVNNNRCTEVNATCLETYVIDVNNKLGDDVVTLLPDPSRTYLADTYSNYNSTFESLTNNWTVNKRPLLVEDMLGIISTDIINSFLIRENLSDKIIGNLKYGNRMETEIDRAVNYNGHYRFVNERFDYLRASGCYWTNTEYNVFEAFAVKATDENTSRVYGESKSSSCNVVPVIEVSKSNL